MQTRAYRQRHAFVFSQEKNQYVKEHSRSATTPLGAIAMVNTASSEVTRLTTFDIIESK